MPELPEVETMVRGVSQHFLQHTIIDFLQPPCRCRPITLAPGFSRMRKRALGQKVVEVRRVAKRVVLQLENGFAFVIEPRMTGLMLIGSPPSPEHLRLEWRLQSEAGGTHSVWFWDRRGLGTVRLLSPAEQQSRLGERQLGPDALLLTLSEWQARLRRTRRAIKVALLDQKLVAGIGNLYASEILHRASIHPESPANTLSLPKIRQLHAATIDILQEAIRYEGSTLGDGTYRNALNNNGSYQNKHVVYGKQGERCATCQRGEVQRIVQAQRSTFFCPRCQRAARTRS